MTAQSRSKALVPLLIAAGVLAVAVVVVLVMFLGRPTEPAATPSTPSPSSSSSSSAAPEPAASTPAAPVSTSAAEVAMSAEGFEILAQDGSRIYSYRWADDAELAVVALTEAFGSEPVESYTEGDGTHFPDYTSYSWEGFDLLDMVAAEGGKSRSEYFQPSYVILSAAQSGGVDLTPEFDLRVGMSVEEVRALEPDTEAETADGDPRLFFAVDRTDISEDASPRSYSVWVITDDTGSKAAEIIYRPYLEL